jgi:sodium-dependent dicarboxylate transporter 2/3/5
LRTAGGVVGAALVLAGGLLWDIPGLEPAGERMLGIFLAAIILWASEAIPLVATSMGILLAEVLLISSDGLFDVADDVGAVPAADYLAALASPVVVLFIGGFMIAAGATKFDVGRVLSSAILRPLGGRPRPTLLGVMAVTATLGMFMSNTATTATMFAIMLPAITALEDARSRTAMALAIPVAASVGGMMTPVGTPPNAIAIGILADQGIRVTFLDWVLLSLPVAVLLILVAWAFLAWRYLDASSPLALDADARLDTSRPAVTFYAIAGLAILGWLTEPLHGLSSSTVSLAAVVALLALRVMDGEDVKRLDWPVLWLVAGGIALGRGVGDTGLDSWLIGAVPWGGIPAALVLLAVAAISWGVSNFVSSTAAANLLVPMSIGISISVANSTAEVAVVMALACSLGMCLPVSTPPNAIAHATGLVPTRDMVRIGLLVGGLGVLLLSVAAPLLWSWLGLT